MSTISPNDSTDGFEYFSSNLGFKVVIMIEPPTDERLQNGLNFLDPDQILPLAPFLEKEAFRFAGGNQAKSQDLLRFALNWDSELSLSQQDKIDGMNVLDAAYDSRMKGYRRWQQDNLIPEVNKGEIVKGVHEAISTALANFERITCEDLAEKVHYSLRTSLKTPEGTYESRTVRGRRLSIFRANPGRTKGSKNSNPKVTYERLLKEIKRFKNNEYGIIPSEKEMAVKFSCSQKTIKNCLLEKGEKRRFSVFARALLEENKKK
jgi:hypothetical protein